MSNKDFRTELKDYILNSFPDARLVSGGKEIVMRCRFCGDSANKDHKHLYIGLGYDNKPLMFNCFKCGESGILTPAILRELSLDDYSIIEKLVQFNKNNIINSRHILNEQTEIYYMSNNFIRNCSESYKKRDYINSRLGLNLSFNELLNNKIVLNIFDLLDSNRINYKNNNFLSELDKSFVGFLSEDNNFLIERNVDSKMDLRYYKYNIHGKINTDKRYYILPCRIDMMCPEPIDIHIAEGPFDILSVKYNLYHCNKNNIFLAMGGKAYKNAMRHILSKIGLFNVNFHLYVDKDVSDYTIGEAVKSIKPFNVGIYLHRNMFNNEKDYGVPKDHIIDNIVKIN